MSRTDLPEEYTIEHASREFREIELTGSATIPVKIAGDSTEWELEEVEFKTDSEYAFNGLMEQLGPEVFIVEALDYIQPEALAAILLYALSAEERREVQREMIELRKAAPAPVA